MRVAEGLLDCVMIVFERCCALFSEPFFVFSVEGFHKNVCLTISLYHGHHQYVHSIIFLVQSGHVASIDM